METRSPAPWKLFLDDVRDPRDTVERPAWRERARLPAEVPGGHGCAGEWTVARCLDEAVDLVERLGPPSFASLDFDLCDSFEPGNGEDFARWLVRRDAGRGFLPETFGFEAHSESPSGRGRIQAVMLPHLDDRGRIAA